MPYHFYLQDRNVLCLPNKIFSSEMRKLSVQHHKEENQTKPGFISGIKQFNS